MEIIGSVIVTVLVYSLSAGLFGFGVSALCAFSSTKKSAEVIAAVVMLCGSALVLFALIHESCKVATVSSGWMFGWGMSCLIGMIIARTWFFPKDLK